MEENQRSAVVLVVDRLSAGFLGPYGNTWLETPFFNRLAAESLLVETLVADAVDLATLYRSYLHGVHAFSKDVPVGNESLIDRAGKAGLQTCLVSDDAWVAGSSWSESFSEVVRVALPETEQAATLLEETQIARLFAAAIDAMHGCQSPFLLWIHGRGLAGSWDAPYEMRMELADESDPLPPNFVEPPHAELPDDPDPDQLLGLQQAYAAQVSLLDTCLGLFLQEFRSHPAADDALLLLTSPRGYPLGQHQVVGGSQPKLLNELFHVPCLLRSPDLRWACRRTQQLHQPADISVTLSQWLRLSLENTSRWGTSIFDGFSQPLSAPQNVAASVGPQQRMIHTPSWLLRAYGDEQVELYNKPDDRWEVNEVANRCRAEVEGLLAAIHQFEAAAIANDRRQLAELQNILPDGSE